jgi:hypothetical protein
MYKNFASVSLIHRNKALEFVYCLYFKLFRKKPLNSTPILKFFALNCEKRAQKFISSDIIDKVLQTKS